jgi:hypothetical protein
MTPQALTLARDKTIRHFGYLTRSAHILPILRIGTSSELVHRGHILWRSPC